MPDVEFKPWYHALVRREVFPLVPRKPGGKLLDFGGGTGATALELRRLGYAQKVGAIDVLGADKQNPELGFRYQGNFENPADIQAMIDREGPFDTILCLDILEHLTDPWKVVAQLHTALLPGGHIVASIPNVRNFRVVFPLLFANSWHYTDNGILDRTHLRFFVRRTAIELMTSSGLELEEARPMLSGGWRINLLRALTLGLFPSFSTIQYLIRVRRPL